MSIQAKTQYPMPRIKSILKVEWVSSIFHLPFQFRLFGIVTKTGIIVVVTEKMP